MVPSLRSLAAIVGLALLVHGCSDDPERFPPTSAVVVPAAITVGGLTYQREIVDASSPPDPWMKNIAKLDADNLPDRFRDERAEPPLLAETLAQKSAGIDAQSLSRSLAFRRIGKELRDLRDIVWVRVADRDVSA